MIRAGIDIGTNTVLLLVAEVEDGQIKTVLEDRVRVVRLGKGVDVERNFLPEAMTRAHQAFEAYSRVLQEYPGCKLRAVATSGSRDARNAPDFFAEMSGILHSPIEIISGEEEAQLSFAGALSDREDAANAAVLDIGGGSTEVIAAGADGTLLRKSFDVGCVRMFERHLHSDPHAEAELEALREDVRAELSGQADLLQELGGRDWIGVAGTATYICSAVLNCRRFDPDAVHATVITLNQISSIRKTLSEMTAAERLGVGGMDHGRADVIVAGAIILEEFLKAAGRDKLQVSVRGLRYGLVLD